MSWLPLLVLVIALPIVVWLLVGARERPGRIVVSLLVGHTAWHWMVDRGGTLVQTDFAEAAVVAMAALLPWLVVATVVSAILWRARSKRERAADSY